MIRLGKKQFSRLMEGKEVLVNIAEFSKKKDEQDLINRKIKNCIVYNRYTKEKISCSFHYIANYANHVCFAVTKDEEIIENESLKEWKEYIPTLLFYLGCICAFVMICLKIYVNCN